VASLAELARVHTDLQSDDIAHLQRLVASWGLLADLSFADLLLFASTNTTGESVGDHPPSDHDEFVVLAQIRPTTSQTVYRSDWVGSVLTGEQRAVVAKTHANGELLEGELVVSALKERVRVLGIPVRHGGRTIAVMTKESTPTFGRQPGELERTYVEVFNRFARMIAAGEFPFETEDSDTDAVPRVGDGVLVLDGQMRVQYSSPNGVSALHRIGIHANAEGMRLGELGLDEGPIRTAFAGPLPVTREVEHGPEVTVVLRCIPLLSDTPTGDTVVSGAVLILRDISEVRRRDRLLLSKDATIREIHHRVKNNLQTISSLLRLQARRFSSPEAKLAIEESVRRIRSIALVHETLSREAGDDVAFIEIVRPLVRMVEEGMSSPDRPVRFRVEGEAGSLPATVATPLSVVLNELLQNAIDHAFPEDLDLMAAPGSVLVTLRNDGERLHCSVVDDGVGLAPEFSLESVTGLGLSIVRTLVTTELAGTIDLHRGAGDGHRPGTIVELDVPVAARE